MNCNAFYKVYDSIYGNNAKYSLEDIRKNTTPTATEHEDTLMSILFALNGYPYRIWKDNPEHHRGSKEGAFLHGYKEHYDFKKQGLTDGEYFARVSTSEAVQDIRMGRISPWCTFATDQGSRLIDRLEPGQVQTLIDYIEPLSWKARVKRQQGDADWVQEVFNKAEIK
jgi:hypothetical protein